MLLPSTIKITYLFSLSFTNWLNVMKSKWSVGRSKQKHFFFSFSSSGRRKEEKKCVVCGAGRSQSSTFLSISSTTTVDEMKKSERLMEQQLLPPIEFMKLVGYGPEAPLPHKHSAAKKLPFFSATACLPLLLFFKRETSGGVVWFMNERSLSFSLSNTSMKKWNEWIDGVD